MSIEAIAGIGAGVATADSQAAGQASKMEFSTVIEQGLGSLDGALKNADQTVRALASGQEIATHDVMISLEEARMQMMLVSEIRNRVIEAYQELSRMQL